MGEEAYPAARASHQQEFWVAIQVRPRTEIAVARHLKNKGYEEFLPTYTRSLHRIKYVVNAEAPLFPGYVFCKYKQDCSGPRIVTTPGVIRILGTPGRPAAVSDHEISAIRAVLNAGLTCRPERSPRVGQSVIITSGPLEGVVGTVARIRNSCRLILCVGLLRRAVSVEIASEAVAAWSP
jgi:transcription antitermination factor NusG